MTTLPGERNETFKQPKTSLTNYVKQILLSVCLRKCFVKIVLNNFKTSFKHLKFQVYT